MLLEGTENPQRGSQNHNVFHKEWSKVYHHCLSRLSDKGILPRELFFSLLNS